MENIEKILSAPIFFKKNRVGRVYTGGALFADFFGDDSVDGYEPEEWVASSVKAINKDSKCENEGVSKVLGAELYFDTLLNDYKARMLGDREEFGVLTKVLDSAIRLPVQAHPDKAFSREYFGSNYGKAESWIILATRPDACIYFGFKDEITEEEFETAIEQSLTDNTAMEKLLNRVPVSVGDVYFVPAKMVHAIGKGCLILEIQEPTDFTIQPEYFCGEYRLNDQEMYLGLDKKTAIEVFDFSLYGEKAVAMGKKSPKCVFNKDGIIVEDLITYDDTPCFAVKRYDLESSQIALTEKPAVYIVTEGDGVVTCNGEERKIKKGDYFFLPYSANETVINTQNNIAVVACLPPQK